MELALQRIEACKKSKSDWLDLTNCGLNRMPEAVATLSWVKYWSYRWPEYERLFFKRGC
jgi:hypothetical protein